MAEFASKGVAGSGLGLGIAGTALSVLNSSANGNGLLGGLFGNGNQNVVSALQAENGMLKAEKYSDNNVTKKIYANITSELTSEEVTAIKQFAKAQFTDKSNTN